MNSLREQLREKWREASATTAAGREWRGVALDVPGPVHFVAAVREPDSRIAILLETPLDLAPAQPYRFVADGLSVTDQRRPEEDVFRLAVTLEYDVVRDVFEVLAADLVEVTCQTSTVKEAIADAIRRLEAWRACLRARRLGLSPESQIGLIGELIILRLLADEVGHTNAVEAWRGPLQGIHDFSRAGISIEVKTVAGVGTWLEISRLSQLETAGLSSLVVARPRLQQSSNGMSLVDAIAEFRSAIDRNDPAARAGFDERLIRAGYLEIDATMYANSRFLLHEIRWYQIASEFPRLTPTTVPAGIIDAKYVVDERSIVPFQIDQAAIQTLLRSMKEMGHA